MSGWPRPSLPCPRPTTRHSPPHPRPGHRFFAYRPRPSRPRPYSARFGWGKARSGLSRPDLATTRKFFFSPNTATLMQTPLRPAWGQWGVGRRGVCGRAVEYVAGRWHPWRWSEEGGGRKRVSPPHNQGAPAARGRWPRGGGEAAFRKFFLTRDLGHPITRTTQIRLGGKKTFLPPLQENFPVIIYLSN